MKKRGEKVTREADFMSDESRSCVTGWPFTRFSHNPSLRAAGVAARSERLAIGEPFGRDVREERGTRGGGVRSFLTHPPCGANGMSVG